VELSTPQSLPDKGSWGAYNAAPDPLAVGEKGGCPSPRAPPLLRSFRP